MAVSTRRLALPAYKPAVLFAQIVALAVAVVAIAGCSSTDDAAPDSASTSTSDAVESTTPPITEPDTLPESAVLTSIFDLNARDCFTLVDDRSADDKAVWLVPCEVPHDGQVITELDYAGPTGESNTYAGEQAVREAAEAACIDTFEPFVGVRWTVSSLELLTFWPSAESWRTGDTQVICAVVRNSSERLVGTQEGTGN